MRADRRRGRGGAAARVASTRVTLTTRSGCPDSSSTGRRPVDGTTNMGGSGDAEGDGPATEATVLSSTETARALTGADGGGSCCCRHRRLVREPLDHLLQRGDTGEQQRVVWLLLGRGRLGARGACSGGGLGSGRGGCGTLPRSRSGPSCRRARGCRLRCGLCASSSSPTPSCNSLPPRSRLTLEVLLKLLDQARALLRHGKRRARDDSITRFPQQDRILAHARR